MIVELLLKSELEKKLDKINENFNVWVDKYIGDGLTAMLIVLGLIVVSIIIIRKVANR